MRVGKILSTLCSLGKSILLNKRGCKNKNVRKLSSFSIIIIIIIYFQVGRLLLAFARLACEYIVINTKNNRKDMRHE